MAMAQAVAADAQEASERPGPQAWYALAVVILATIFGFVDRQILVLITEPLKRDLGITDTQIGLIQGIGPGLFAAVGVVGLGWLADRTARQHILAVCVVLWSIATAACGLAQNFGQLLVAGVAIALGEAALAPVFYSIVPDLFPGKSRTTANLVFFGAFTIGAGVGVALSGSVISLIEAHRASLPPALSQLAAWRLTFLAVAAPGILIGLLVALIGPIARRTAKAPSEAATGVAEYYRAHWRTAVGFYLAMGLYGLSLFALYSWAPVYMIRVLKASPAEVGYGVGAAFGVGSIVGVIGAGIAHRLLKSRFGIMTPMRIFQACLSLALIPIVLQLWVTRPWEAYVLTGAIYSLIMLGAALTPTMLQDLSPAETRGRVIALATLAYSVLGSLSPMIIGALSDAMAREPRGLISALVMVSAPSLAAAVLLLWIIDRPFRRTIEEYAPR
jgi:MFS family permease